MSLQQAAANLLLAVKKGEDAEPFLEELAGFPVGRLERSLLKEAEKKAFWINCYNAFFLYLRRDKGVEKPAIYRDQLCRIAGRSFSLDDIEHGILRKYRAKIGLGYLPNLYMPRHIRALAVEIIDYRIHFTLNCGAVSCPPIATYRAEQLEQQLDLATQSFLESETSYDEKKNEIHFTRLGWWYLADFGGKRGIRRIVQQYLQMGRLDSTIKFKDYNWEENLDNFVDH